MINIIVIVYRCWATPTKFVHFRYWKYISSNFLEKFSKKIRNYVHITVEKYSHIYNGKIFSDFMEIIFPKCIYPCRR